MPSNNQHTGDRVCTHPRRKARRDRAAARAAMRAQRSTQEQLDLIATRPGDSVKEVKRLSALLV